MPEKKFYIAYGSNLNMTQMRKRCPNAVIYGVADLEGWELLFKGSKTGSYLTIEKKEGSVVPVAVWEITDTDEWRLDVYEGFPDFYYKKELTIPVESFRTGKVRKKKAFAYIMHEDRPIGIPSERYMQTCAEGYHNFGFNLQPLAEAYWNSREECRYGR